MPYLSYTRIARLASLPGCDRHQAYQVRVLSSHISSASKESGTGIGERLAGVAVAIPGDGALVSGPAANSISIPAKIVAAAVTTTNYRLIFHRIHFGKGIALVPLVKSRNFLPQIAGRPTYL
jgi:hypothetical protein